MPENSLHRAKSARATANRRASSRGASSPGSGARGQASGRENFAVVGIGASAGGLVACTKLLSALPVATGMAFIIVQHLDPTHESMLAALLTAHTAMPVLEATNGMMLESEHIYIIPPGSYLSVRNGTLNLSNIQTHKGLRLPFDFLLNSLAGEYGKRAVCVVLSGTGADGALGLKAVKDKGGFVIVQEPAEAEYDGMPRNAILTGAVDSVLTVEKIPQALSDYNKKLNLGLDGDGAGTLDEFQDRLAEIIELLRTKTAHDFRLYKAGTLQRRIERRMAMSGIEIDLMDRYLALLRSDKIELDLLAKDLLINVTSFFRDPKVFDFLAETIIPELVQSIMPNQTLRIWVAGCSSGEETYSLAILFLEQLKAAKSTVKLQIFASDIDSDAIATAREGLYPDTIVAEVSPQRLEKFFSKEDQAYRVLPQLRGVVVFTVQDVLADPPFSRLDLVSCRNLLIYLRPEAQAKIISIFHFALREGGVMLLGSAETAGNIDGRFEVISKQNRIYRHTGRPKGGEVGFILGKGEGFRQPARPSSSPALTRQTTLAELCQQLVMQAYAPAAVLINRKNECLYFLGPTDRYLSVAQGNPTHDIIAMARPGIRIKLRAAIQQAAQENKRIAAGGAQMTYNGQTVSVGIDVQPVLNEGEELLLVCFTDDPKYAQKQEHVVPVQDISRVAELERELEATRAELRGAIRNLEIAGEEQTAINEETLSVNEEFQSTNEELLTSKEELQSLNEELTALNSQLQETLERQRTTSNDLQNILYSTDIATIFLDEQLNIRFFTPATRSLFKVIASDIGRPLSDLTSLAGDSALLIDAATVLNNLKSFEREIEAQNGAWYVRHVLPYRTHDNSIKGVVITFTDITERKQAAKALETAKQEADLANIAKSRFLAAASHDLRQPLQTLTLLQGLLTKMDLGAPAQKLIALLDPTLNSMSGMLNTLLDINQIDAGTVNAEIAAFPIENLLDRLRTEFTYHAHAQGLGFHVESCSLIVESDHRLLEQMIRNLLANALKYTKTGKVLLGCRRREGRVSIEIWDTGIGIPDTELQAIFGEYHQLDNAARERSRGLGLGLSIVQRLGDLLNHRVTVRSHLGKGSVFAIEVALPQTEKPLPPAPAIDNMPAQLVHSGAILVIDDDPEVRALLELFLRQDGHRTATAYDGPAALELVAQGTIRPDLILADYNLPNGMDGIEVTAILRERLHREIPVIILTGDISTGTLREIASHRCIHLNKPVKLHELSQVIQNLLPAMPPAPISQAPRDVLPPNSEPVIFVVDDNSNVCESIRSVLEEDGKTVETYSTCEAFLEAYRPGGENCLLIDAYLPGMSGIELLQRLRDEGHSLPSIMITGNSDVPMAVRAMKAGASDFIEKPIGRVELLAGIERALEQSRDEGKRTAWRETAAEQLAGLTSRQRQILGLVLAGQPSKNIASDLGISQRTVETHRSAIMKKTGCKSLPALARLALAGV